MSYIINKKVNCNISIFFAMILVMIMSLIFSITELSRMKLNQLNLQIISNAGIDSMMSLYNKKLWEMYRLFSVDYKNDELINNEYYMYINKMLADEDGLINNWANGKLDKNNSSLKVEMLIDNYNYEKEIIDYTTLAIVGKAIKMLNKELFINERDDIKSITDEITNINKKYEENIVYNRIENRYFDFDDNVKKLEKLAENIYKIIRNINTNFNQIANMSSSGSLSNAKDMRNKLNSIVNYLNNLISELNKFKSEMEIFREKVKTNKNKFDEDINSGKYNFNNESIEFINEEFKQFDDYVSDDSKLNDAIRRINNEVDINKNNIYGYNNELNYYINRIEDLEDEIKEIRRDRDADRSIITDLKDEIKEIESCIKELIIEIKQDFRDVQFTEPNMLGQTEYSKEKENALKNILNVKDDVLLHLVLDEQKISKINRNEIRLNNNSLESNENVIDKVLIGEWCLSHFNYYGKNDLFNEDSLSKSTDFEVERMIANKNSDIENLKTVINKILIIRTCSNLLFLYTNSVKREQARTFTYSLFAGLSPIICEVIFVLLLSAWAYAQSIVDIKNLLEGKLVNFIHTDESFSFDLGSLLTLNIDNSNDEHGIMAFNYKDYLRILLFIEKQKNINTISQGIIEHNIKKEYNYFEMKNEVVGFNAENSFECSYLFTKIIPFNTNTGMNLINYKIRTKSYGSFAK